MVLVLLAEPESPDLTDRYLTPFEIKCLGNLLLEMYDRNYSKESQPCFYWWRLDKDRLS